MVNSACSCDQNDDIGKIDPSNDKNYLWNGPPSAILIRSIKMYALKKDVNVVFMSLEELRSFKAKKILRWKSCFRFREMVQIVSLLKNILFMNLKISKKQMQMMNLMRDLV